MVDSPFVVSLFQMEGFELLGINGWVLRLASILAMYGIIYFCCTKKIGEGPKIALFGFFPFLWNCSAGKVSFLFILAGRKLLRYQSRHL